MHRRSSARRPPDPYAGDVTVDCLCRGHSLAIAGERVLGGRQFGLRQNARQTARIAVAFAVTQEPSGFPDDPEHVVTACSIACTSTGSKIRLAEAKGMLQWPLKNRTCRKARSTC